MIRLINDMNGFSYFNTSNVEAISMSKYPDQYGEYIDNYTTLKFRDTPNFNTYYRFKITKDYAHYNPVINQDNPKWFRIVRFDNGGPDKAILIGGRLGEVIVAKASELLTLENIDAPFCERERKRAELMKYKYFDPNPIINEHKLLAFFEKYNEEKIWEFPVQDYNLLGRLVWIEYKESLKDAKSNENTLGTTDEDGNFTPTVNDFSFTSEMKERLITANSKLRYEKDYYLAYFPYTYNIHSYTRIDLPRRTYTMGVIIRADLQANEPHIVVMEMNDDNNVKFVCDDEANFYYDTQDDNNGTDFNPFEATKNYTPYGIYIEPEEEESEEEETTPEEESEESQEGEDQVIQYDDVIIHIKSENSEEESGEDTEDEEDIERDSEEEESNNEINS